MKIPRHKYSINFESLSMNNRWWCTASLSKVYERKKTRRSDRKRILYIDGDEDQDGNDAGKAQVRALRDHHPPTVAKLTKRRRLLSGKFSRCARARVCFYPLPFGLSYSTSMHSDQQSRATYDSPTNWRDRHLIPISLQTQCVPFSQPTSKSPPSVSFFFIDIVQDFWFVFDPFNQSWYSWFRYLRAL